MSDPSVPSEGENLRRSSLLAMGGSAILQASQFLVFVLLAHRLPPAALGAYRLVTVLLYILALLYSLGAPWALLYALGRAPNEGSRGRAIAAALLWMLLSAPLLAATMGGVAILASRLLGEPAFARTSPAAALLGFFAAAQVYWAPVFLGLRRPGWYLGFTLLQTSTAVLAAWYFTRHAPVLDAALFAAAVAASQGFLLTVAACLTAARFCGPSRLWREHVRPAARYGSPIALSGFLHLLGYQVDHLIAGHAFAASQYGTYTLGAWQLPLGAVAQQGQHDAMMAPMAAHHSRQRKQAFWHAWGATLHPLGMAGAFLFWGVFLTAPELLHLAFGPAAADSVPVFRCYSLVLPLQMAAYYLPLRAAGSTRPDVAASLAFFVVNALAGVWLAPHLGLVGPAVGVVAGWSVWTGILVFVTARTLKVPLRTVFPFRTVLASLAVGAALAVPLAAVAARVSGLPVMRLVVFWSLYLALAAVVGVPYLRKQAASDTQSEHP